MEKQRGITITKKEVSYTQKELSEVIEFVKGKKTISILDLQFKFQKNYHWGSEIMDVLEEFYIVAEFNFSKDRIVLSGHTQVDC
jgi:hypothetical protein